LNLIRFSCCGYGGANVRLRL